MMTAVEMWGTYRVLELQDEALHPLQLAGIVGCDGPCSRPPGACTCSKWLRLTTSQNASVLRYMQLAWICMQIMPKHSPYTLTGIFCLPLLLVFT